MLDRADRMLVAVHDREQAAETFIQRLQATPLGDTVRPYLNASCREMAVGESFFELCEPTGAGPTRQHLERWGEGLFRAGYQTPSIVRLSEHLKSEGVAHQIESESLYIDGDQTAGLPMVITASRMPQNQNPDGSISFIYESTNTLESDWRTVASRYARIFKLNPSFFSPISNERFGYDGTLTLFDPDQLHRIELSQTFADQPTPMRRFVEKRGGDSLYMCFVEAHGLDNLKARLLEQDVRLAARGPDILTERDTFWVHPRYLHGVLLGVSRTGFAWQWSGQPNRVPALN